MLSYREYISQKKKNEHPTQEIFTLLAESHPVIRDHRIVQNVLNKQRGSISAVEVARINKDIMQKSIQLAKQLPKADYNKKLMIIAEQNVLNTAASILSTAVAVKT